MTNELIAEKVMQWVKLPESDEPFTLWQTPDCKCACLPDFINDMNAAMLVVEKMRKQGGWGIEIGSNNIIGRWYVELEHDECFETFDAVDVSLPKAIATAALKAME